MSVSDTYENDILNHILRNTTLTFDSTIFIGLHTADPGEAGTTAELTDSGYARKAISFNAATTSGATNNGQIDFNSIVDGTVTVTHFSLWTLVSGGTFIFSAAFSSSKQFIIGATPKILDTALTISTTGNWSNYLIPEILDHILGTLAYTSPATVQVHLYTTNPTAADTGTEVSGNGYTAQTTEWDAPSGGLTDNTNNEQFGGATGSWGTVTHWGIRDAGGTNLLFFNAWDASFAPANGDDVILNAGDLDITLA